ncbi:unnamed protein product [Caenorhabditis angaria]|uniref:BTB domain-containing protein n=1 Tax=Caenorhabditis angaria TaxID=860376 RepID=A0A9P1I8U1_9PELO|nr:unnamed protein product [Caenorhabditis angaria]
MNPLVFNGNKLRWKFEDIKNLTEETVLSNKFTIGPVDWVIKICLTTFKNVESLTVRLAYDSENKNDANWICEMKGQYKILRQSGAGNHLSRKNEACYHKEMFISHGLRMIKWKDFLSESESYIKDNAVIVEIDFNFRYYDFSKNIENITDMIVTVNDTEFHLNKWAMASRSDYFQNLIMNTKPAAMEKVKLEDITTGQFCLLLASFYPFFNIVSGKYHITMMEVARKFGVPSLHQKIEQYLLSDTKLKLIEKIKYADENDYEELMEKCIESLKTGVSIKNLQTDEMFHQLKETTKMDPVVNNANKIRWKFDDIKSLTEKYFVSDKFTIGPVDWIIKVAKEVTNEVEHLSAYLHFISANKNDKNWLCQVDGRFKLLKQDGAGEHKIGKLETCYHKGLFLSYGSDILKWADLLSDGNGFIKNDSIIVEVEFNARYFDFSKRIDGFTDIIVNVDKTDFHVNKGLLCSKSHYFYDLLVDKRCQESSIELSDLTTFEFCNIVANTSRFYGDYLDVKLDAQNMDLIELAKKYGVPSLHQKCEQYLISKKPKLELIEKLKYADANDYEELMTTCIESLETGVKIKNLQADARFVGLKEATKLRIMNRLLDFF